MSHLRHQLNGIFGGKFAHLAALRQVTGFVAPLRPSSFGSLCPVIIAGNAGVPLPNWEPAGYTTSPYLELSDCSPLIPIINKDQTLENTAAPTIAAVDLNLNMLLMPYASLKKHTVHRRRPTPH